MKADVLGQAMRNRKVSAMGIVFSKSQPSGSGRADRPGRLRSGRGDRGHVQHADWRGHVRQAVTFLVSNFAPEAKGHGVPEVMDAMHGSCRLVALRT